MKQNKSNSSCKVKIIVNEICDRLTNKFEYNKAKCNGNGKIKILMGEMDDSKLDQLSNFNLHFILLLNFNL